MTRSLALIGGLLLAACGAQSVRTEAEGLINRGKYEQALKTYEDGLQRYPQNVELRSSLISAQESVFGRLMKSAAELRATGRDAEAEQVAQRALAIHPNDERAKAMLLEIARDRRQSAALASAKDLLAKGLNERAMLVIESALKDNPRSQELQALQRQLELEARQSELGGARLSEARPVSLDFRDANLRMVLEVLTRNSGINFVIDKDVRQDLRTTVFLRQSRLDDALELLTATSQLSYKVVDPTTVLIYPKTPEKTREYQDLMIRAFYLSSADVRQTALLLKNMLKIRDPFIDEKINLIVIRETPQTIRLAERLIALQDLAEPEVMMEVEVLEIKRASLTELGIKYPDGFTLTPIAPAGGFTLGNFHNLNRDTIGVNVPAVTLNLHRDVGDVNILANPKIRARNREKAKIMIGDKLPVVTTTGNAGNSNFISESVQYVDVGLKLDVEPNIYLDDEVAIKVGLEVSSLVREIKTGGGSLVYQIGTRTASTVLRLKDGETQLLAGLISNEERMSALRVPGVGDLPVLGRLFSSQRDDNQRTEIVLSVTPRIVRNIRRPDVNQAEFWSGTENDLRSRPLTLGKAAAPAGGAVPAANGIAPAAAGQPAAGAAPAAPPQAAATPEAPVVLQLQMPDEVKAGEVFAVLVNVKSGLPLRGMPVQLEFPPQLLQVMDAEEGAFLKQDGVTVSKTKTLEQAIGHASMAVLRNSADGVQGSGTVAAFRFKALAAGKAGITLVSAKPVSSVTVAPPALPETSRIVIK
ncbi:general secretion pathway protein GspD [Rugamonas sp. A1-17]|nr:general secretion pathway protein GspD [Rugamonas sp. A1-17]